MSVALSSISAFAAAVAAARSVDLAAYTLRAGTVRDALLAAAHGGARVRVRLEREPLDDAAGTLRAANADTVATLAAAGADAALTPSGSPILHLKAAVVDEVAWLDDRNWAGDGPELVVRDTSPSDVDAITTALAGGRDTGGALATTKSRAQGLEIELIRGSGAAPLAVESESFGGGAVYNALLARARAGLPTRLIVARREAQQSGPAGATERRKLAKLAALGAAVRTGGSAAADVDEKLAVAGGTAWMGSANATYARGAAGTQRDWGLTTQAPELVSALRDQFERNWNAAAPLK